MLCIYIYIYVYMYIYTVYIIDKTYVMWLNSLVNLSIKHHQVVKMALWVCHSTWKNSSICGWWTYSTVSTISGKKVDLWRNQKNALQKIFQRSQQQVEPGGTFFHIFTCSGCATIHNPNFRATINGAHGAHMVRPILPPRPGWSLHLAQAQWLCQKINGKQGQW